MRKTLVALCVLLLPALPAAAQTPQAAIADLGGGIKLELRVPPDDLDQLRAVLKSFAQSEGLAVDDKGDGTLSRDGRPLLVMGLVRKGAVDVTVTNIHAVNRVFVWIHDAAPATDANSVTAKLARVLREKWPNLTPYQGPTLTFYRGL